MDTDTDIAAVTLQPAVRQQHRETDWTFSDYNLNFAPLPLDVWCDNSLVMGSYSSVIIAAYGMRCAAAMLSTRHTATLTCDVSHAKPASQQRSTLKGYEKYYSKQRDNSKNISILIAKLIA